jgi:hypothetical protein
MSVDTRLADLEAKVASTGGGIAPKTSTTNLAEAITASTTTTTASTVTTWLDTQVVLVNATDTVTHNAGMTADWVHYSGLPQNAGSVIFGGYATKDSSAGRAPKIWVRSSSGGLVRLILYLADSTVAKDGIQISTNAPCSNGGFDYFIESGLDTCYLTIDGYQ